MFCVIVLFFSCDKHIVRYQGVDTYYFIKNTSNQTISFDITVPKGERVVTEGHGYGLTSDSVYTFKVNANDSIIFLNISDSSLEDLENHLKWFIQFEISPLNGIQINDPYLPENWVEYKNPYSNAFGGDYKTGSSTAYLFILNKE